jgi:hypothetical protein
MHDGKPDHRPVRDSPNIAVNKTRGKEEREQNHADGVPHRPVEGVKQPRVEPAACKQDGL